MNSALKPILAQQPGGQGSPAKANVASVNHAVGHPQGAANSLHHGTNSHVVGQNLTHHTVSAAPHPAHAVPSMAPVSANMAQMAQNMSHHGNLSHVTQNSVTPVNTAASPSKSASTSAPLSLVQDKANTSQPLALTRTPEKKEPDSSGPANGTVEPSKSGANTAAALKPQNPEPNKDKQDIAKTSPSTPKPPEKQASVPNTPQKSEAPNSVNQTVTDGLAQPKVAMANEPPEKSPTKPTELKTATTADIAPTQSDSKPESANNNQEKAVTLQKQETPTIENVKTENPKVEEKQEDPKIYKPAPQIPVEEKKGDDKAEVKLEKIEVQPEKQEKVEETPEEKKPEVKPLVKTDTKVTPRSTMKLATVTPPMRKRRQVSPNKISEAATPAKKVADGESTPEAGTRTKRNRTKVQLYQSPTPELTMATKLSASAGRSTPNKPNDDKLIVFYRNEYLAVRNAEGGFYVCQAMQNVYRTTRKIKIRWLSQDKSDPSGETYKPDFYDLTDMECVLTTLSLTRAARGGGAQTLSAGEQARARSILERALRAEQSGANNIELTEEHPDGLDLSLYTDESQLEKKSRKRNNSKYSPRAKQESANETAKEAMTPAKRARPTPKRSPKIARKAIKQTPTPNKQTNNNNKRKSPGSTPSGANTSKTATAVTEKAAKSKNTPVKNTLVKNTPAKRTPSKSAKLAKHEKQDTPNTPARKGRRAAKESKPSPIVPTPSTSTGKTTRTPRKPPAKK